MSNIENRLTMYASEGYNVLLTGKHGIGKTAIIKSIFGDKFGELGKDWLYFSASTLDPWVDFIGIPKNYTRPDGTEVFRIIPPEHLADNNQIKAIFFDEINRAEEKTLNAVMELIQFKSINGRKFENLKCIWAAENPADDKEAAYSVKPLDPAQKDRFQIQIVLPEALNLDYFQSKYPSDIVKIAAQWWKSNKETISPRKLDDILYGYLKGYDISDFTNHSAVKELKTNFKSLIEFNEAKEVLKSASSDEIDRLFDLKSIRQFDKLIKADSDTAGIVKSIYENIKNDEIKAYLEKQFNYNRTNKKIEHMTNLQKKNAEKFRSYRKQIFNTSISIAEFGNYVSDFNNCTDLQVLDTAKELVQSEYFPYKYSPDFTTLKIRDFLKYTKHSQFGIKEWLLRSMYLLSKYDNKTNSEIYKIICRLAGNTDFVKEYKLNKIFFAKWKRGQDMDSVPFEEYARRMFG